MGLLLAIPAIAATNTVSDTVYDASGGLANGSLQISWPTFTGLDGNQVPAGFLSVPVRAGVFSVNLEPNDTATPPGTFYTVNYSLTRGARNLQEFWVVPTAPSPAHLVNVRTAPAPTTSFTINLNQLAAGGATNGQCLVFSTSSGTWGPLTCPGGGGGSFGGLTTGVNVSATMTVGTGATLTFSGFGVLNANQIAGTAVSGTTGTTNVVFSNTPTIVTPTIASFVNATHNHQNAAGGGQIAEAAFNFTNVTTANATSSQHGLMPKLSGSGSDCFLGNGTFGACSGSSGANTNLSNLVATNINVPLLAQSGIDLGSPTQPFRFGYIYGAGTYGTTYFRLGGTPTGADVITIPDVTGTLTVLGNASTGSGSVVLANTPTLITPVLGVATGTSFNGLTITTTTGTFTLTNAKTLSVSNTLTFAGTDATTITFQGTDTYVGRGTTDTLTNKTLTTPTIADFTNATHNHSNNAGGGQISTTAFAAGNKTGTGTKLVTATAAGSNGNCMQWTAAGDAGDAGAACGSGGGGAIAAAGGGGIFAQTSSATVANTTTETTVVGSGVGSMTLPANFFSVGKAIRISVRGYHSAVSAPTIRWKIKLGSTVILDTTAIATNNSTNQGIEISALITGRTTGASGSVFGQGSYFELSNFVSGMTPTATSTIDTTATQTIDVTVQWGTASASDTVTITDLLVDSPPASTNWGGVNTVTFSATPNFDLSLGTLQLITLTGNITSFTVSNPSAGVPYQFEFCQDSGGNHTVSSPPATFKAFFTIGSTASKCSAQTFRYDGTNYITSDTGIVNQ